MSKKAIKIIKRSIKGEAWKPQLVGEVPKAENNDRLKMDKTVNNWILERREKSRAEKIFSDGKILAWKMIP